MMPKRNVFKLKYKNSKGENVESKNYYFYHNRKKINTNRQNKRSAQAFLIKFLQDEEARSFLKRAESPEIHFSSDTLLQKLKNEGWIAFDSDGNCLYKENPKYKWAKDSSSVSYGAKQAKQVGQILYRVFETHKDPIGTLNYNQITKLDAFDFRNRLANYNIPNSMKNEALKALRAVYTFWENDETIFYNPFKKTNTFQDFPRTTKDQRDTFSDVELKTIFNTDLMRKLYPDDKKWLLFLKSDYYKSYLFCALTGMRSAEVRSLLPSQIVNDRILTIDRAFKANNTKLSSIGPPKWNKTRVIVLCDSAYNIISQKLSHNNDDSYIFKNQSKTNAMEASRWNKEFAYFMEKIKLKYPNVFGNRYFTPHCFRKTLNTLLIHKYKCNPELVIDYLGWGEDGTKSALSKVQKDHYTITKAENLLVVAQNIEKMYSGKTMLWIPMVNTYEKDTDFELKKMNMLYSAGLSDIQGSK